MSNRHDDVPVQEHAEEEEIDSAATTLLASAASSKAHSFEEDRQRRKYAEIELEEYDRRQRGSDDKEIELGDEEEDGEDDHLLGRETEILRQVPAAAETAERVDGESEPPPAPTDPLKAKEEEAVTWSSLPKKSQLAILTLARLSEPLTQTSLSAYMFYQLKSFHAPNVPPPSDAEVARQVGILAAAFTGAQFCTAIMWGRLADSEYFGRKKVILIGLLGTAVGSLGFGFSSSFAVAVFWRAVGGCLNGNMGVMRTMVSEIVRERKYLSRAFLLLPMTFNIGVIIGPLLGGVLADPVGSYPAVFGPGGSVGGKEGVWWLTQWPYALPNVVSAVFLFCSALGVIFGLEETLEALKDRPDCGLRFSRWILRAVFRRRQQQEYAALAVNEGAADDIELATPLSSKRKLSKTKRKLPIRRMWTRNVLFTLLAHGLMAMHVGGFQSLWFVFLSTPRYTPTANNHDGDSKTLHVPDHYRPHLPFTFTGGLALPPPSIGTAMAILGVIGISLQLLLYPRLSFYFGTIMSFRCALLLFPLSYTLVPFLAVIPSSTPAPHYATGALIWIGITMLLSLQVFARTFALPSAAILVNNSSPHPSVLGTMHGVAQSVSSATRTVGPVVISWLYGVGLGKGMVGLAWWFMAGVAVVGAIAGRWVREGDGHEIWLEGEREEMEEEAAAKGGGR